MRVAVRILAFVITLSLSFRVTAQDKPKPPEPTAAEKEAAYTKTIEKRSQDIVDKLGLTDDAKATRVRDILTNQYRALRDWHDANDAELKTLGKSEGAKPRIEEIKSSLTKRHDAFLEELKRELNDEQIEKVKDGLTYNVVRVTYDGYGDMLPTLTDAQKSHILATLKEAREEAMDGGSSDEKHAIFGRYKGRINNYLSKEGYDLKTASKEWQERLKREKDAAKAK